MLFVNGPKLFVWLFNMFLFHPFLYGLRSNHLCKVRSLGTSLALEFYHELVYFEL